MTREAINQGQLTVVCDLCGRDDTDVIYKSTLSRTIEASDFSVFGELGEYPQIVRCRHCDLIYANPRDTGEALKDKYKQLSVTEYLEAEDSRRLITEKDAAFIKKLKAQGKLLDIGCSAGLFLASLGEAFDLTGIEPSVEAASKARAHVPRARIINDTLQDAGFESETFDVVTMWDVIEHLESPSDALRYIHDLLTDDGYLVLVTPDIGSLLARAMGKRWTHLIRGHIFYYTRGTMRKALAQSGYQLRSITNYKRYFKIRYVLRRIGLIGSGSSWTDRIGLLDLTIPINFGDAMLVVAQKKPVNA